ncbi:MFS transporter [Nonomuraea typhae]|uniref:MFS transporter n=1 Tax=Nonomuraea typhae TaxID=2603600 RepID=A0ABW7Z2D4_9ACTN
MNAIKQWAGLAVLSLPTALLGLDVTVLYLVLPSLAQDVRPSGTQTLWIMDAYGFLIAGFLITMGTLGDRIGRRKLLLIGAAAFGVVSVAAAYAAGAEMLIAARAALGVAGATLMPSTLALISNMFTDARQRALAIGVWVTMFSLGMAAGPLVGGLLAETFWWGAAFLLAVPVVGVLLVAAPYLVPEHRAPESGRFDLPSVALSLAAILPVIYGVKELAKGGPGIVPMAGGAVFAVLFVRRQLRLQNPLLDVRLFAGRAFSAALGVLLAGLVGVGGVMLLITQYLQLVRELSPMAAGAWMGPPALMMFAAAIGAPLLARRVRPGFVMAGTLAVSTVGYLLLTRVDAGSGPGWAVAGFALVYFGLGAIAALGTDLVVGAAPPDRAGSASALSETVQELGLAVGVALLGSLAGAVYRAHAPAAAVDGLAGAAGLPGAVVEQAKAAFLAGLHLAALAGGAGMLILSVVCAVALRHVAPSGASLGPR